MFILQKKMRYQIAATMLRDFNQRLKNTRVSMALFERNEAYYISIPVIRGNEINLNEYWSDIDWN